MGEKTIFDWKFVVLAVGLAFEVGQAHIRLQALEKEDVAKTATIAALTAQVNTLDKNTATKADVQKGTDAITALTLEFRTFAASFGGNSTQPARYRLRSPSP